MPFYIIFIFSLLIVITQSATLCNFGTPLGGSCFDINSTLSNSCRLSVNPDEWVITNFAFRFSGNHRFTNFTSFILIGSGIDDQTYQMNVTEDVYYSKETNYGSFKSFLIIFDYADSSCVSLTGGGLSVTYVKEEVIKSSASCNNEYITLVLFSLVALLVSVY